MSSCLKCLLYHIRLWYNLITINETFCRYRQKKGTEIVMTEEKVCILTGSIGAKEDSMLEKYASQGCRIAFMDTNKELGKMIKEELERVYHVAVFFFHGTVESEEDRDIFFTAVEEMYGKTDYIICRDN